MSRQRNRLRLQTQCVQELEHQVSASETFIFIDFHVQYEIQDAEVRKRQIRDERAKYNIVPKMGTKFPSLVHPEIKIKDDRK